MSSQKTEHYELNQWLATDQVLRTDFNADNAKIDGALAGLDSAKAEASVVESLIATVAEHTAAIAQLGNCEMQIFSYVGNGASGQDNPTVINFPKRPAFFLATGSQGLVVGFGSADDQATVVTTNQWGTGCQALNFVWNGSQARFWWQEPNGQLNASGKTYWVLALYDAEEV